MRRGDWREHVRAQLQAREGRLRGLRRLLERHEEGVSPASPPPRDARPSSSEQEEQQQQQQQVALLAELLRSAEAENRQQRARLASLAREVAALERERQEAESRAWRLGREKEALWAELREAQAGRLALEALWLREKAREAARVNRALEEEEKYRRKVSRLQEKLARARGQSGQLDGRGGGGLSPSSQEDEAAVPGRGSQSAEEETDPNPEPLTWGDSAAAASSP